MARALCYGTFDSTCKTNTNTSRGFLIVVGICPSSIQNNRFDPVFGSGLVRHPAQELEYDMKFALPLRGGTSASGSRGCSA